MSMSGWMLLWITGGSICGSCLVWPGKGLWWLKSHCTLHPRVGVCCEWKDGITSSWKLSEESHPLQWSLQLLRKLLMNQHLTGEWIRFSRRETGLSPRLSSEVLYATNTLISISLNLWQDAIDKEMKNVCVSCAVLADGVAAPSDQYMTHEIWRQDGRFLVQGLARSWGACNKSSSNPYLCPHCAQETMRITLLLAALNDVDIWANDVLKVYNTVPFHMRICTTLGKEFGDDSDQQSIIVWALYGVNSHGAAFRAHLAEFMHELAYQLPSWPRLEAQRANWQGGY